MEGPKNRVPGRFWHDFWSGTLPKDSKGCKRLIKFIFDSCKTEVMPDGIAYETFNWGPNWGPDFGDQLGEAQQAKIRH